MNYRTLGRTKLSVSEVGFGAWAIGGNSYGATDDGESLRALEAAFDSGVNFYDTADIYGEGHSEELIGKFLKGKREKCVVASKVGWDFYHGGVKRNFDPEHIQFACEQSLKRLGVDCIDVYQYHNPNAERLKTPGFFEPMKKLQKEGKIRFYGISIHLPEEGIEAIRLDAVDTLQLIYNLIDQRPARELLPLAKEKNIGVIAREPFACGMLTGKYNRTTKFEGPDHRRGWNQEKIELDIEKLDKVRALFLPALGSLPVLALKFVLDHEAVSTVIPGAKKVIQVLENISASEYSVPTRADLAKIRRLYETDPIFQEGFFRK